MPKIRVLIVDDAVVVRRLVSDCLASDPDIEVAGTAASGSIALAKLDQLNPDIVTLDIEMETMDGIETLAAIRAKRPKLPVIMFSTLSERGAAITLDALAKGANDYVTKPANVGSVNAAMQRVREELIPKIKALCGRVPIPQPLAAERVVEQKKLASMPLPTGTAGVLAIGVSTGGPNALAELLPLLAANFPVPILIVQHMPPLFTKLLAKRIATVTEKPTREGENGAALSAGGIWLAPGGFHMEVERNGHGSRLRIHEEPPENSCRPAVDVLFRSVAKVYGPRALAVVLTGMGQDGLIGSRHIREAGGRVLAQDEASSVVWGMPGAVAQAGLAHKTLPLDGLAAEINRLAGQEARTAQLDLPHLVSAS